MKDTSRGNDPGTELPENGPKLKLDFSDIDYAKIAEAAANDPEDIEEQVAKIEAAMRPPWIRFHFGSRL